MSFSLKESKSDGQTNLLGSQHILQVRIGTKLLHGRDLAIQRYLSRYFLLLLWLLEKRKRRLACRRSARGIEAYLSSMVHFQHPSLPLTFPTSSRPHMQSTSQKTSKSIFPVATAIHSARTRLYITAPPADIDGIPRPPAHPLSHILLADTPCQSSSTSHDFCYRFCWSARERLQLLGLIPFFLSRLSLNL